MVGAGLLLRRAKCHFALHRWLEAVADAGRAAKIAGEGDDRQVRRQTQMGQRLAIRARRGE